MPTTTKIPRLNIATASAIYDGAQLAGFIIEHDGSWFAYGRDHILIGEYETRAAAVRAVPKVLLEEK